MIYLFVKIDVLDFYNKKYNKVNEDKKLNRQHF